MAKVLRIEISCSREGIIEAQYHNLVGLTDNHLKDAIAFSASALLAQQLSVLGVKPGGNLRLYSQELASKHMDGSPRKKPYPIKAFMIKMTSGIDYEQVPKSFNLDIEAVVTLISRGRQLRTLVKPNLGLLSRFPEERMAMLVVNYIAYVLQLDLNPYSDMVPVSVEYVAEIYREMAFQYQTWASTKRYSKKLGRHMTGVSLNLYDTWSTTINKAA